MWVWSLGQEDPWEEKMATRPSILQKNPIDRGAWAIVQRVTESDRTEWLSKQASKITVITNINMNI